MGRWSQYDEVRIPLTFMLVPASWLTGRGPLAGGNDSGWLR
jgi:hypothetical protein